MIATQTTRAQPSLAQPTLAQPTRAQPTLARPTRRGIERGRLDADSIRAAPQQWAFHNDSAYDDSFNQHSSAARTADGLKRKSPAFLTMDKLSGALRSLGSQRGRREFLSRHKLDLIVYFCGFSCVLFVYHFISDGDFSFLLTLGSLVRLLAFVALLIRVVASSDVSSVSQKTMQLYSLVFFFRLLSLLYAQDYLPADPTGDWLYQVLEALNLISALTLWVLVGVVFVSTYKSEDDAFGKSSKLPLPHQYGSVYLAVPTLLAAVLVHPTLNRHFFFDVSWTYAMYLETFAVLPQLYMFQKSQKSIDAWTSHFVFLLGLSRIFMLFFWLSSHHELSPTSSWLGKFTGMFVVFNQIVHVVMMGDYMYYWLKSAKEQTPLSLPGLAV